MTIEDIKRANRAAGHCWFEPAALRFFGSMVHDRVHEGPGGVFFVSSERQNYSTPRLYSVRQAINGGRGITTIGEFQGYASSRAAHAAAERFARGTPPKES